MSRAEPWSADDLPDLSGRAAILTGANSGIGLEATRELARAGARVTLACRDLGRAEAAIASLRAAVPDAALEARELDLARLASVRKFAEAWLADGRPLDLLVNNAGTMAIPYRRTADGFEMQLGTNHLGHFALTGLLLERLLAAPSARVVSVGSSAHWAGAMRWDDLHWERGYSKWRAYAQSKLANLLFSFELQRRLAAAGSAAIALACHPGYAATNLQTVGPRLAGSRWRELAWRRVTDRLAQSAAMGALPTLYAAAAPEARGGDYIGPDRFFGQRGRPTRGRPSARARDATAAARLWRISQELTGVSFGALG